MERAFKALSQGLEHRELITKEEVRKSRELILQGVQRGSQRPNCRCGTRSDQIVAACPAVSRKLTGMCFYAAFLVEHGQDFAVVDAHRHAKRGRGGLCERGASRTSPVAKQNSLSLELASTVSV